MDWLDGTGRPAVWLDCDPGHDDALAIILAAYRCNLLGISTVYGNQSLAKTTTNAARICYAAGIDVPIYQGASRPLWRPPAVVDHEIHGESGLEGCPLLDSLPAPAAKEGKAVIKLAECIAASAEPLTIIATGCLTNIALFVRLYPELLDKVSQIVFMGGAINLGNRSAAAEFNIICDPEAAAIVCDCGVKVVMVPLEVTHTALATEEVLSRIGELGGPPGSSASPLSGILVQLLTFFRDTYKKVFDFDAPPVHDPCAVAYVLNPALFDARLLRVDVDCTSGPCVGRTCVDLYNQASNEWNKNTLPRNVHVAFKMDVPAFWELMLGAFRDACGQAASLKRY